MATHNDVTFAVTTVGTRYRTGLARYATVGSELPGWEMTGSYWNEGGVKGVCYDHPLDTDFRSQAFTYSRTHPHGHRISRRS